MHLAAAFTDASTVGWARFDTQFDTQEDAERR